MSVAKNNFLLLGNLAIVPTLFVVAEMGRAEFLPTWNALVPTLQSVGVMPIVGLPFYVFNNSQTDIFDPLDSKDLLQEHVEKFIAMGTRPIRNLPATIAGTGSLGANAPPLKHYNTTRFSVGGCCFPDDLLSFSICIHSVQPWEWFETLRERISHIFGASYFYSLLGYGFACNGVLYHESLPKMRNHCFRYIGADLDDLPGLMSSYSLMGLHAINWQVEISNNKLSDFGNIDRQNILKGAVPRGENWLWKTGAAPSMCDRNNPDDWASIADYAALSAQLNPLIFLPNVKFGVDDWNGETINRWRDRWTEVTNAIGIRS